WLTLIGHLIHPPTRIEGLIDMAPTSSLPAPAALAPDADAEQDVPGDAERGSEFASRHLGPRERDMAEMLRTLGLGSLDDLVDATVPADIRLRQPLTLDAPLDEHAALAKLRHIAGKNRVL